MCDKCSAGADARRERHVAPMSQARAPLTKKNLKRIYGSTGLAGANGQRKKSAIDLLGGGRKKRCFGVRGCRGLGGSSSGIWERLRAREGGWDVGGMCDGLVEKKRFANMKKVGCLDTYDRDVLRGRMLWLQKRTNVSEIVSHEELLFALTQGGVCAVFDCNSGDRLGYLDSAKDEVILSLFMNKKIESLITLSVRQDDGFAALRCRSISLGCIRRGELDSSEVIFDSESLRWPGFVEFDDVNSKVLTYSINKCYKVWDLASYRCLYSFQDESIEEIKISPGVILLVYNRCESHVPLRIIEIETGCVLKDFNFLLHRNRNIQFVELFNEKLLVKQENENLQIFDVHTAETTEVTRSRFLTPSAFIFLYDIDLFLTFRRREVSVWNYKGQLVTEFEDHVLWPIDPNINSIYITKDQDLIMSYCKQDGNEFGSINVSWIKNGKLLAKVSCDPNVAKPEAEDARSKRMQGSRTSIRYASALSRRLSAQSSNGVPPKDDVASLYYNEARNEIYAGMRSGFLHVWSN
eukprot:Plantae.Rhodophyta-Hildenbrandia_rubra.ctg9632.p1 GENE.Plantae.Rhodophyta-Hildenbrandia_rubra.ctg9632~~Plantae.Rhodophyta-Hildenbrandia_rubra.ctg9632.p1  ORF type:complete len:522 (-),score=72.47 Plantae.Rhodophyta-Hildenbrandia_rubra.ctg9632:249-1814(-)